jgi:hypothetical protein
VVFCILVFVFPPSSIFAVTSSESSPSRSERFSSAISSFLHIFNPYARASLVRSIFHAAVAPFGPPVRFRDNLVADVACSLVRCLVVGLCTS